MGRVTGQHEDDVPLARLFAIAYRSLIDDLHVELRARGWTDVRPAYGFVLLAARDEPTSSTAVAALMGVTKQAASKLIDGMETAGLVVRKVGADARQRPVSLSRRGRRLLATVEEIYAQLEQHWADIVGVAEIDRLRRTLTTVLMDPNGHELPPVRPPS